MIPTTEVIGVAGGLAAPRQHSMKSCLDAAGHDSWSLCKAAGEKQEKKQMMVHCHMPSERGNGVFRLGDCFESKQGDTPLEGGSDDTGHHTLRLSCASTCHITQR